jgi:polyadenylate-binding protein
METLYWLSPKDQPEYIGEELYSRLYAQYKSYTGKIVGMFLEFDVSDLVELLENSDLLKEKAEEAFDLLNKHNYQTPV